MKTILLLAFAGSAAAQEIKPCPDQFPVESIKITAPVGWVGVAPPVLRLTGADVVVGEPTNGALVGEQRKTRRGYEVAYGEISTGLPRGTGIWLACRYGDLALAQRLPDNTDRCMVSYTKNAFGGHSISVTCRTRPDSSRR